MLSCFQSGTVVDPLQSTDKFDAIREVVARSLVFSDTRQRRGVERAVLRRERIQSTGIGHGVATAHAQTRSVNEVKIALGISRCGIDYHSIDGAPVQLLFVLATPPGQHRDYLTALSSICRLSKRRFFADLLAQDLDEEQIQRRLCDAFAMEASRGCSASPAADTAPHQRASNE